MVYTLRFFFALQNAVCFIILTYLVPVLLTFCIHNVLKLKKKLFRRQKVKGQLATVVVVFVQRYLGEWGGGGDSKEFLVLYSAWYCYRGIPGSSWIIA